MTKTEAEEKKKRFNAISRDRAVTAEMANDYAFALGYLEAFSLAERLAEAAKKISSHWNIVMPNNELGLSTTGHLVKDLEKAVVGYFEFKSPNISLISHFLSVIPAFCAGVTPRL